MNRAPYRARVGGFEGSLGELAFALRSRRLSPFDVDLLALVRDFLAYFEGTAERDLDLASEALPAVAQVIELKLRLLLPRAPQASVEDEEVVRVEAVRAIETLHRLEAAIDFLRARREQRRFLVPARTRAPTFDRPLRPLRLSVGALAAVAARYRLGSYFEIARDRLGVPEAIRRMLERLRPLGRASLRSLTGSGDWATRTIYFAGLLELVKEQRVVARQETPFGDIELEPRG